jgi:hypothetical protein
VNLIENDHYVSRFRCLKESLAAERNKATNFPSVFHVLVTVFTDCHSPNPRSQDILHRGIDGTNFIVKTGGIVFRIPQSRMTRYDCLLRAARSSIAFLRAELEIV